MITAVDSSVLLDVLCGDSRQSEKSGKVLRASLAAGRLIICECVVAEVRPALSEKLFEEFVADWEIHYVPSSLESATLAGKLFQAHLKRGGRGGRVIPDFLIGAHAKMHADRLLARDRGYLRDYFQGLRVINP